MVSDSSPPILSQIPSLTYKSIMNYTQKIEFTLL